MSVIASIDARVKLGALVIYLIAAFHVHVPIQLCICAAIACAAAVGTHLGARGIVRVLRPLWPILVITLVMQIWCNQVGTAVYQVGVVTITAEALYESVRMLVVLFCVMVTSASFMRVASTNQLSLAILQLLVPLRKRGVRIDGFAFSLSVAFRFVPVLVQDFQQLRNAHLVRGAQLTGGGLIAKVAAYTRLFAPLIRGAFRRSDTLAYAACSRCFGQGKVHSVLHKPEWGFAETVLLAGALAVACVIVYVGLL